MNDGNFLKFIFLAAVIGAVLFSRMAYPAAAPSSLAEISPSAAKSNAAAVPMFVLPSTAVSAGSAVAAGNVTGAATSAVATPVLMDAASLVANLTTGAVYEATNTGERWPTASLAKLMSATIVLDKLNPATKITITESMFATDPSEFTLVVGSTYTVSDLLHLMLLPSSNVAAEAVATFYGRDAFMAEMNARATAWEMADTHYDDPSGISAGDQSTANDLMKLAQKIYANYPQILQISRLQQYYVTEQNSGKKILIKSINDFAGEPDFIGGKTGHTDQADGNLLSLFNHDGQVVLIVVLGSNGRFNDTKTLYDWYKANF